MGLFGFNLDVDTILGLLALLAVLLLFVSLFDSYGTLRTAQGEFEKIERGKNYSRNSAYTQVGDRINKIIIMMAFKALTAFVLIVYAHSSFFAS